MNTNALQDALYTMQETHHRRPERPDTSSAGGVAQDGLPLACSAGAAIAAIYCPTTSAIHPAAAEIDVCTLKWLTRHELYASERQLTRLRKARPGTLAARVAPGSDRDRLQVFADFHTWLFAFDDEYCDEDSPSAMPLGEWMAFLARLHRQTETGTRQLLWRSTYAAALQDISLRLAEFCNDEQRARWLNALHSYFHALAWEAQTRRAKRKALSLEDYTLLRLRNGAMQSSIALLDVVNGYFLPSDQRELPAVRALIEMTAVLVSWDNDIFSWHKESSHGDQQNLLCVLGYEAGSSTTLREAVRLRNGIMKLFVEISAQTVDHGSRELGDFVKSLHQWVRANLDFSRGSARYADPSRPAESGDWATTCPADWAVSPLRLRPIQWWASVAPPRGSGTPKASLCPGGSTNV
jgi:hypothetical protein